VSHSLPSGRQPLSLLQLSLLVIVTLLILIIEGLILNAYLNISATTASYEQVSTAPTTMANIQREILGLQIETYRLLLHTPVADLKALNLHRTRLTQQLQVAMRQNANDPLVMADLKTIQEELVQYDALFTALGTSPTSEQLSVAAASFRDILSHLELQIKATYDREEIIYYETINRALQAQRAFQTVLLGVSGLVLLLGVALVLSLRRSVSREFEQAYRVLMAEMAERQQAEATLRESEARKGAILEAALDCIITIDHTGRIIEFNPAAEKTFGYSQTEVLGQQMADLIIPPALQDQHRQGLAHYLTTGEGPVLRQHIELTAKRADRTEFPVELSIVPLPSQGQPIFTGFIRDITKRKAAEATLRASEERFRTLIEHSWDSIWLLAADGVFLYASSATHRILGYAPGEVIGQNVFQLIHPEDFPHTTEAFKQLLHPLNGTVTAQARIRHKDGSWRWLEGIGHNRLAEPGLQAVVINCRDITERRQAEVALRQANLVVENSPAVLFRWQAVEGWPVRLVSENVAQFGYSAEAFLSETLQYGSLIHPDDLKGLVQELGYSAHRVERFQLQYRLVTKAGEVRWVSDWRVVERDPEGQLTHYQGIVIDITESKQAEEAFLARDQALAASRLKSEFLARVSHELRTPLSAIIGYTELLQMGSYGPTLPPQDEVFSRIMTGSEALITLVNELLDQASFETGRLTLHLTTFTPAELIEPVLAKLSVLAQHKGLSLTSQIRPEIPPYLSGDFNRLQQILTNLVGNAIKFTQTGGVQIHLYRSDGTHWALEVSDTGSGIPAEAQGYIFEPFRQLDGSVTREHGGSGLGLSIVKELVTLMGGRISLKSKVGQGSIFTVLLPLRESIQEELAWPTP
jgi:two-component system, chemotaxis family, CheB/CheR fusion protein